MRCVSLVITGKRKIQMDIKNKNNISEIILNRGNVKKIIKDMIKKYELKDLDFIGYDLSDPEYHHLIKRSHGGETNIQNGAILTANSHEYLHNAIEQRDIELYKYITRLLQYENEHGINYEVIKIIQEELNKFYEAYKGDKNSKGKKLIKNRYLLTENIKKNYK